MDDGFLEDLFACLPAVSIRRLFGGRGIYADGVIVAIVLRGELLLKADEHSAPEFREAGSSQWVYAQRKTGKPVAMPYWRLPESALDDPDEMERWARLAFDAGMRTPR